jgi:imidazolonepropionase-like amidohydrolase
MKRLLIIAALAVSAATSQAQDLLITNATLHAMGDGGVMESADILIEGGRVAKIADQITAPSGVNTVDAAGKPVTPALFAGVTATGLVDVNAVSSSVDNRLQELFTGLMHPEFDIRPAYNPNSAVVPVTRVEGFGYALLAASFGDRSIPGSGTLVRFDGGYDSFEGKHVVYASVTGRSASAVGGSRAAHWMLLNAAFDELKLNRDELELLSPKGQQVLAKAVKSGVFVFTAHRASDILQVIKFAKARDIDVVILGAREAWMVRDELASAGVPVIINSLDNLPADFDSLGARIDNAALLHDAGVKVMFSSGEVPNARKVRQVAGVAAANGLPHAVALAGITTVPAEVFGGGKRVVERGAVADLVIWSGDPLEVTTWAEQVIMGGVPDSMESRQTKLRDRYLPREAPMGRGYIKP